MPEHTETPAIPRCSNCGATTAYGCDECGPDSTVELRKADLIALLQPTPLPSVAPLPDAEVPKHLDAAARNEWFACVESLAMENVPDPIKDRLRETMQWLRTIASLRAALAAAEKARDEAKIALVRADMEFQEREAKLENERDAARREAEKLRATLRRVELMIGPYRPPSF